MKVLHKDKLMADKLIKYVKNERKFLAKSSSFIVSLNYSFQTSKKLFLILYYCLGGDLGFQIQGKTI
jgi:serine/threonine protein kinase